MLTITPPVSCPCITALARCENTSGAIRLRFTIAVENFGDTVALSAGGLPPALLTSTSRRPKRSVVKPTTLSISSGSRMSAAMKAASRPSAAGRVSGSCRQQITTSAPKAR